VSTIRDLGVVVSSTIGMVIVLCLSTMSSGLSMMVSNGLIGLMVSSASVFWVFTLEAVMSARGEPCSCVAPGDAGALGVGGGGGMSRVVAMDARDAVLWRFRVEALFGGSPCSSCCV